MVRILSLNFLIFTIGGVWRPIEWSTNGTKLLYNVFSFCAIASNYFLMITQFMDIILVIDNMDDFITNFLLFVTMVTVCCKATIAVMHRNAIINLVQALLKDPCKPRDKDEMVIQRKFDKFIRSWSIRYILLGMGSVTSITVKSVQNIMQDHLPYKVWLPYDCNTNLIFLTTSIHQIITLIFAAFINVGMDSIVFGFFLQICAQLEIFESRLCKLIINRTTGREEYFSLTSRNKEQIVISDHIRHHFNIYKYAKKVNNIFNQILFTQFFGSILVLCTSMYYMLAHITEFAAVSFILYIIGMFVQIYVYCWSGNEVILKSTNTGNAIYHMNWPLLSISERKDLLMIMKRSTVPIKFTSSFLITLSLQSYSKILKTSYSAFNVLKS